MELDVRTDLALAEAIRGLDEQRATLDTIQQRAGVLLAFAAIANVGLGQPAFGDRRGLPLPPLALIGILAALASAGLLLSLCWPRSYQFTLPATSIVAAAPPFDRSDALLVPTAAKAMEQLPERQEKRVDALIRVMKAAVCALVLNGTAFSVIAIF